jgi:hypothetical protein
MRQRKQGRAPYSAVVTAKPGQHRVQPPGEAVHLPSGNLTERGHVSDDETRTLTVSGNYADGYDPYAGLVEATDGNF